MLLLRPPAVVLLYLSLFTLDGSAQLLANPNPENNLRPGLQGKVLNPDGKPASGIHVELDEARTSLPVTSTYTRTDGTFELYNIPAGDYEVVAESTDLLTANPVTLQSEQPSLQLRLSHNTPAGPELAATISVAQMMVPTSAQKLFRKAQAAFNDHKYDKSASFLDQALQIEPQYADALALRGLIELGTGKIDGAQADFEHATQIDPSCTSAYIGLGAVYNHQGRFDDAMRVSERSLSLMPKSWQGYFEMAKASIAKGMYAQGLQFAHQAQRLSGNSFAAVHLVNAYALVPMRFYKSARYELQAFLAHDPSGNGAQQAQALLAQVEAAMPASLAAPH
jgi:tetratricopeptide (TPR) repeat protein